MLAVSHVRTYALYAHGKKAKEELTDGVTSSLLELFIAAKNYLHKANLD